MEIKEICKEWNSIFKNTIPGLNEFLDKRISVLCGKPQIDLLKFDDFLRQKYKYDEGHEISLSNFIKEKFGNEAVCIVKKLI